MVAKMLALFSNVKLFAKWPLPSVTGPLRFVIDAALGFAVFVGLTVALLGPSSAESLLPVTLHSSNQVMLATSLFHTHYTNLAAAGHDPSSVMLVLGVVFSALFALNMSFVRHLVSAYRLAHQPARKSINDPSSRL